MITRPDLTFYEKKSDRTTRILYYAVVRNTACSSLPWRYQLLDAQARQNTSRRTPEHR